MNTTIKTIGIAFLGGAMALGGYSLIPQEKEIISIETESPITFAKSISMPSDGNGNTLDFKQAANNSLNSVVHINTQTKRRQLTQEEKMFEQFYGNRGSNRSQKGSGSGVIISNDGYIVTNNHVVENADNIKVILNDNREYIAKVIGTDPSTDMAVLKIEELNLSPIVIGNSDEVEVGEWVLAVGNPFNLTSTVTAGIVSAKGRSINIMQNNSENNIFPIESFIQTDAAVNPGNSGGALVNTKGELIGINTAIASQTGSYSGYSFAVPVNIMKKVTTDMIKYGIVQRGFIGVGIQEMNQNLADKLEIENTEGVFVNGLSEDGAAEKAGIKKGDVIVKVNSVGIKSVPQLQEQVGRYNPGDKIKVFVLRDGKEKSISVTLRNHDGNTGLIEKPKMDNLLGSSFEIPTDAELKRLRITNGVKIEKIGKGKLQEIGIKKGFIITKVDKQKINSIEGLRKQLKKAEAEGVLIEGIYPNGVRAYYGIGM
ncbi:Do family serine endopeptidase [Flavobacteriales bacterium]|nr:Do family serine endopeptidase [Flavobacteriales bacterium]